jgi:glutaminase
MNTNQVDGSTVVDRNLRRRFDELAGEGAEFVPPAKLKKLLSASGVHKKKLAVFLRSLGVASSSSASSAVVTWDAFKSIKEMEDDSLIRYLEGRVVVPHWQSFCDALIEIYDAARANEGGQNAQYIPQLARVNSDQFGLSVCTVDGQVLSHGDSAVPFSIQSCSKPITYCVASEELGDERVKRHVGHEPSGVAFNAFVLDKNALPHNPMVNAGAIMCASLVKSAEPQAERFDHALDVWSRLAANRVGFDNATYLSELASADRNFALAFFMKDAGAFPDSVRSADDLQKQLELYFQLCSILATCEDMGIVAGTLANGGVNPVSGERIFQPETVRNALSLMFSCGMYDYSGEFAYSVGLPAKSGVAGCVITVVPGKMGIATWSPRLDAQGNSVRGVDFFTRLVDKFALHCFDAVTASSDKIDPFWHPPASTDLINISEYLFAAATGDIDHVRQLLIAGCPINAADYDKRSALHVATAEGHYELVAFLLRKGADPTVQDRWQQTPADEADALKHQALADLLRKAEKQPEHQGDASSSSASH